MKKWTLVLLALGLGLPVSAAAKVKLTRYPHYHEGRIAFSYLGDVWTASEDGTDLRRLTVHVAPDVFPRFSPDGRWIAFSSSRYGNLDVFLIPVSGGMPRRLTYHSADDAVLGWSPDSARVLFSSQRQEDFSTKLYTVEVDGGMPRDAGPDMGVYATFSPDGTQLAINRKSQRYWRKHYRGSNQSDVTVMETSSRSFVRLTESSGMDRWPMWGSDGYIYFVSDRHESRSNLWKVPANGGEAHQVTHFSQGEVRWPAMSADGRVITFEHDHEIWRLDLAAGEPRPIELDIAAETQVNRFEMRSFASELDDYDLHPSGRRIAFSVHGEIFTAPVEEGDLQQITDGPARDHSPRYSPDGQWIAYITDMDGRDEVYVVASDGERRQRVSQLDSLKGDVAWSGDSGALLFTSSDNRLRKYTLANRETVELATSSYGLIGSPSFSPDGRWVVYTKPDHSRRSGIYLVPAAGGEEREVTLDAYSDSNPVFAPDGEKIFFIRGEGLQGVGIPEPPQVWSVTLVRLERDPSEPADDEEGDEEDPPGAGDGDGERAKGDRGRRVEEEDPGTGAAKDAPEAIEIDWQGLEGRTRGVTRMPYGARRLTVTPDGEAVVFVTEEPAGDGSRTVATIYAIGHDGEDLTRITASSPRGGDDGPGSFFPQPPLSDLKVTRDGKTLFFQDDRGVYRVPLPRLAPKDGPGAGASRAPARRRVDFRVQVRVDAAREWAQMFDEAWRTMKHRFYDTGMHGLDWEAAYQDYRPLVDHVADRRELLNVINEMIGELNASHTGTRPAPSRDEASVSTFHLGLDLVSDEGAGRYRVSHVYKNGPADKDWVKVAVGDYLLAIGGEEVRAGENYWRFLNYRLNKKIAVTFNDTPVDEGSWQTRIEPVSMGAFARLRYERWVRERRREVEERSQGRLGYLHIRSMNGPSLRQFQRELHQYGDRQGLVIDQRWNGGGNIEQELLGILVQRPYQELEPRGSRPTLRPASGYFGPKVVLQNHRSGSNAEMFPAGFKALRLGKVVGTPTAGAVIGTGGHRLIDGSTIRTPSSGVYLLDAGRTNMENFGVPPDILVENTPEDNLAGRDRQLEVAVEVLLRELEEKGGGSPGRPTAGLANR